MCRYIGYSKVPLNNEQRFKFAMSTYTRAASLCDQRWTCVLWNQGVKWSWCGQASSQPAPHNELKPTSQPTKTDRPTNHRKQITKQPTKQPISSPTSKYRNQLLKQNEPTYVMGINILLVRHFRIKQSVINTIE